MPVESVIFFGIRALATPPAATIVGFPTIVTTSCVFAPLGPVCSTQVAFVLRMRSARVSVFPPEHGGCVEVELFASGLEQARQCLSPTRITALMATEILQMVERPGFRQS